MLLAAGFKKYGPDLNGSDILEGISRLNLSLPFIPITLTARIQILDAVAEMIA
jgi:hypothetical protein